MPFSRWLTADGPSSAGAPASTAPVDPGIGEAFEHIDGAFVAFDREWRFTFANGNAGRPIGLRPEDLVGRNVWEMFPALRDSPVAEHYRAAMERRVVVHFELQSPVNGMWYEATAYPTPGGIAAHWHDITARKRSEDALRRSEERARVAAEAGGTGLFEWEPLTGQMYWSAQNYRSMGYRPGEIEPSYPAWAARVHPEDLPRVEAKARAAQDGRTAYHDVHRIVWPDGSIHIMESRAQFSYDPDGRCTGMRGTYVDVTDRVQAEEALRESDARFRMMADGAPMPIWMTDATGQVAFVNRAYCEFFGVDATRLRDWRPLVHPDDDGYLERFIAAQERRAPFHDEARALRADGAWRWLQSSGVPRFLPGGAFDGYVGASLDITERRERENRDREAAVQAHFRSLFESLPGSYVVLTPGDHRIVAVSDAYLAATRTTRAMLIGRTLFDVFPIDPDRSSTAAIDALRASLARVVSERRVDVVAVHAMPVRAAEGAAVEERWWSPVSAPVFDPDGTVAFIIHRSEDVTDYVLTRRETAGGPPGGAEEPRVQPIAAEVVLRAQELQRANEHLRREVEERSRLERAHASLLHALVRAQEDERRRVARDLHDGLGQHLTALTVRLGSLRSRADVSADVGTQVEQLQALAEMIDEEVERLALELRPAALDDLGLDAALRRHVDRWSHDVGLPVDIHTYGVGDRLPEPIETTVYRVIQEALTNVRKHATATRASVVVERRGDELVAIVEDDGVGFVVRDRPPAAPGASRLGLSTMTERAALVEGRLEIESTLGRGTTVYLRIPIHEHH